jgi:hypothetical protein
MEAIIADGMRGKLNANLACGAACRRGFGRSVLPMRYLRVIARLSLHPFCLSAFSNAIAAVARCSRSGRSTATRLFLARAGWSIGYHVCEIRTRRPLWSALYPKADKRHGASASAEPEAHSQHCSKPKAPQVLVTAGAHHSISGQNSQV